MLVRDAMPGEADGAARPQAGAGRAIRRSSRPLTPAQERLFFGLIFVAGLLLQLAVVLD